MSEPKESVATVHSILNPKTLAEALRSDAARAKALLSQVETDFDKGFWEGFALGLTAVVELCEASLAIDKAITGETEPAVGVRTDEVISLRRKEVKSNVQS